MVVDALGLDGVLGDAAGGGEVDEPAGGVVVCASALVSAKPLTAATAMKCFNISASWGDVCEWDSRSPITDPASCFGNAQAPGEFLFLRRICAAKWIRVPMRLERPAAMLALLTSDEWRGPLAAQKASRTPTVHPIRERQSQQFGNHSLSLWPVNNRADGARRKRCAWVRLFD